MQEIEAKFLDIDSEKIQKKLEEIGAKKVGEYFYRRRVFDYPDWRLDKDHSWLRLRDEGEKITLSFKKRLGVDSSGVGVNDSGMEKDEIEFDIDTYPGINPYLEIESSSWGKVDEAIRFLELNPNDKKIFSGNQVYALNGIKVGELRRISFDEGLVKR